MEDMLLSWEVDILIKSNHYHTNVLDTFFHKQREGGRLIAIQDQAMSTRMYLKHIAKQNIPSDRCRRCFQAPEFIQHLTSLCSVLAPGDYLDRHNAMAGIHHQHLALGLGLVDIEQEQIYTSQE